MCKLCVAAGEMTQAELDRSREAGDVTVMGMDELDPETAQDILAKLFGEQDETAEAIKALTAIRKNVLTFVNDEAARTPAEPVAHFAAVNRVAALLHYRLTPPVLAGALAYFVMAYRDEAGAGPRPTTRESTLPDSPGQYL